MIEEWDHFRKIPKKIPAERKQWKDDLRPKLDKIARILASISKDGKCVICQGYAEQFKSLPYLADHIKGHKDEAIDYWIDHIITLSPDELEVIRHFDDFGNPK